QTELEPEAEHQEDHPDAGQGLDRLVIADQLDERRVRPDHDAGDDVAEDDRLPETVEEHGHGARDGENDREVVDQVHRVHAAASSDPERRAWALAPLGGFSDNSRAKPNPARRWSRGRAPATR